MNGRLLVMFMGTLTLANIAVGAEEPTPEKAAQPECNQVYVKIIMPVAPV
ncbi:MAG: hypothetical protein R3C18_26135 [Planctomycetaceae bacterium]